jgi:hypothetical protein
MLARLLLRYVSLAFDFCMRSRAKFKLKKLPRRGRCISATARIEHRSDGCDKPLERVHEGEPVCIVHCSRCWRRPR